MGSEMCIRDRPTTLGRRIAELAPRLSMRCLMIVLSDLHDESSLPALKLLAQRHDVVVLQLQDPAETGLRGAGLVRAGEAETGRIFVTRASRSWVDPEETARDLKRATVDHLLIRTDQSFVAPLRNFLSSRSILGRGSR